MADTFVESLSIFYNLISDDNSTDYTPCRSSINHYKFYQLSLIPAVVLVLLMAATKSRRERLLGFLNGRPGLIFPMDTLTRSSRISYCCAFGATGFLVYQILLESRFAIEYSGPIALKTLIAILSMFIYGMVFFPVFASFALGTAFSYGLGTLYVWMFFIIEVYRVTECDLDTTLRAILLARLLPSLLCLGYLSLSLPTRFFIALRNKKFFVSNIGEDPYKETLEEIKNSYQGNHVRKLLKRPEQPKPIEGTFNKIKALIMDKVHQLIYHRQKGFRYPSRLISVMFVSACVVYVVTVEFLTSYLSLINWMNDATETMLDEIGWEEEDGEEEAISFSRNALFVLWYILEIFRVSTIVSITLACVISFLTILHMMTSFRENLYALYRGDYSQIPSPSTKSAASLCVGSIKYAGFQVAYIVWAYIVSVIILFIVCIVLAVIITLFMLGITDWFVNKVLQIWPSLLIAVVLMVVQILLAKHLFLQAPGNHCRLNNRRFYFVFAYFMFFYNIFLGLVSCLLRIIKAIGVGTIFLARLDNSTLPRKFEFLDPGFSAYQGYIHMEVAHTHPVVNVFIRLLVCLSNSRKVDKDESVGIEMSHMDTYRKLESPSKTAGLANGNGAEEFPKVRPVNVAARFNWQVTYTLLHNPAIRVYRKGFIQAIRKAKKEGLKIPISDKPITDFDLIKSEEERNKEREEEAKKIQEQAKLDHAHGLGHGLTAMTVGLGGGDQNAVSKYEEKKQKKGKIRTWFGNKLNKKKSSNSLKSSGSGNKEVETRDLEDEDSEENENNDEVITADPQDGDVSPHDVHLQGQDNKVYV